MPARSTASARSAMPFIRIRLPTPFSPFLPKTLVGFEYTMRGRFFASKGDGHGISRHEIGHRACQADLRRATVGRAGVSAPQSLRGDRAGIRRVFPGDTFDEAVSQPGRSTLPGCRTPSGSGIARPFTWGYAAVNGFVDEQLRALLRVPVSASLDGEPEAPWCGSIRRSTGTDNPAEADGRAGAVETVVRRSDLGGRPIRRAGNIRLLPRLVRQDYETQIAASEGEHPLLGTMLLFLSFSSPIERKTS